jgi:hypothetical protein
MALTVKHLNDDASFLLSFQPVLTASAIGPKPEAFRILLDPWITGPSTILHPKMSVTHQKHRACVASLTELPEPDLVIISQHIPDHCNEATLQQLPATDTKTIILAEPAAARTIRSWKYFDKDKVQTIPKWDDWNPSKGPNVVRIPVKPVLDGAEPGEVTVAFIPQRKDMMGLHSAVGITYRQPTMSPSSRPSPAAWTPPASPRPRLSYTNLQSLFSPSNNSLATDESSPPSPASPGVFSLRSVRSASSIPRSISSYFSSSTAATTPVTSPGLPLTPQDQPTSPLLPAPAPPPRQPVLSVIFSPHGIAYPSLQGYAESYLTPQSALPLTALLHCFDSISNPWWLGGEILLGTPAGTVTAARLGARVWISAHDGDKEVKGLVNGMLRTRKWSKEEVAKELGFEAGLEELDRVAGGELGGSAGEKVGGKGNGGGKESTQTEVVVLAIGEEVVLDCEGVCRPVMREKLDYGKNQTEKVWSSRKGMPRVPEAEFVVSPPC